MALLKELAMLKELDKAYEASPTEGGQEAYRLRRQRHDEITAEIKGLCQAKHIVNKVGSSFRGPRINYPSSNLDRN